MDEEMREILARDAIDLCICALRDLNDGREIPNRWAEMLLVAIKKPRKPGPPGFTARGLRLARAKLNKELGRDPRKEEDIAADEGVSRKEIHRQYQANFVPVYAEELSQRLNQLDALDDEQCRARSARIQQRLAGGENLDDVLADDSTDIDTWCMAHNLRQGKPSKSEPDDRLRSLDVRRQNIFLWLNDGLNRVINAEPVVSHVYRAAFDRDAARDLREIAPAAKAKVRVSSKSPKKK